MSSASRLGRGTPLAFYATPPHQCSYLPDEQAVTVFADPNYPKSTALYSQLSDKGFRRSGEHVYVPACDACQACVPVRVPVEAFRPRRRQRRILTRNQTLTVHGEPDAFNDTHYQLYRRYARERHRGGGMEQLSPTEYLEFLSSSWSDTVLYEFRREGELVAVAVTDHLANGLSAVYTFFEPTAAQDGLGVYAILWQIEEAKRLGLDYLYLGYWIGQTRKMNYKADYLPQEHFRDGRWVPVDARPDVPPPSDVL